MKNWKQASSFLSLTLTILVLVGASLSTPARDDKAAEALGWKLGTQAYTFNRYSFYEAVDKAASVGLKYIEIYPGQNIGEGVEGSINHNMNDAQKRAVIDKVKSKDMKIVAYGVVGGNDEAEWTSIFSFAKEMGILNVCLEPKFEDMDMISKLADEYGVSVALHNHPKPSRYWNPDTVLEMAKGRSKRVGACADTGHWVRSELDPLECIKKLEGKITQFHFKDLNKIGEGAHDVPWGTGVNDVFATLSLIKSQKYEGVFSIEYEYNWETSLPEIARSVEYFDLAAAALYEKDWKPLLKKDLSNAIVEEGGWDFSDGVLASKGKGDIWTKKRYGNFILDLEFKCDADTNSGVFLRTDSIQDWLNTGIEIQIQQADGENKKHVCGAVFDVQAPVKQPIKAAGEWNRYVIMVKDSMIFAAINGQQVMNIDLDQWTEAGKNPDGTANKFKYAYKDMAREGHVGLQYHGQPVWFRNLRIKTID